MITMETIGKIASNGMKHSTFTLEENIAFMEQAVSMAKNKEETCKEWNLEKEDFVNWMFGWMLGTLDSCAKDLKMIAAE